jgi:hypothetical protein
MSEKKKLTAKVFAKINKPFSKTQIACPWAMGLLGPGQEPSQAILGSRRGRVSQAWACCLALSGALKSTKKYKPVKCLSARIIRLVGPPQWLCLSWQKGAKKNAMSAWLVSGGASARCQDTIPLRAAIPKNERIIIITLQSVSCERAKNCK